MKIKMTDEAQMLWSRLNQADQESWVTNTTCQKCSHPIEPTDFSGSIYEGQLALFHRCTQCDNKEVRLIDVEEQNQKAVDDDFEAWVKAKKAANPEKYGK